MAIALPYEFDTSDVWHTILKGAFGITLFIAVCVVLAFATGKWAAAAGLAVADAMLFFFTRLLIRFQTGSKGTLTADQVVVQPNEVLGFALPGPVGTFMLDRFSAVRVEFFMGAVSTSPNAGGPNEIIWLVGRPGTPNVAIACTKDRAGREVGRAFGALLKLPVEELNPPRIITL